MRKTEIGFAEGFLGKNAQAAKGSPFKIFDWDKCAKIIKEKYAEHPDLSVEAGLQRDWDYTAGIIFESGKPTNDSYTYLQSNWATPTMILTYDNGLQEEEIECYTIHETRFGSGSKWDKQSLDILGIGL